MFFYLVYFSKSVKLFDEQEILILLEQSRKNNRLYSITGMLLYVQGVFVNEKEGRFIQVLEGMEEDVRYIYEKIEHDDRHRNLIVLEENFLEKRNFETWTMGFKSLELEDLNGVPQLFKLDDSFLEFKPDESKNKPLELLKGFYSLHIDYRDPDDPSSS
ncbi:BLUF domain-containing protein [Pedobacter sp. SYSU D00535]|uniref:BLUF domain-containing protein n=1 Tax=Pedobacter sp. SYSU D00535 TaxID=2810308 RepID=UPI001A97603C|nr:BLUF domain-containing protein [Pedobacter sp. SYSU D00535]